MLGTLTTVAIVGKCSGLGVVEDRWAFFVQFIAYYLGWGRTWIPSPSLEGIASGGQTCKATTLWVRPTTECFGRSIRKRFDIKRDTYGGCTPLVGFAFVLDRGNQRIDFDAGRCGINGKGKIFITRGHTASRRHGLAIGEQHRFADGGTPL